MIKVPHTFYVDTYVFLNGGFCSHLAKDNQFDPSTRCYDADAADARHIQELLLVAFVCFALGALLVVMMWMVVASANA